MRVAMYYSNNDIRIEESPTPKIGDGEILMRVCASGICGSDVMEWYRIHRVPLVLGHELAGEIMEVGNGVKGYKKGDRIVVAHHVPCGQCRYCKSGHETVCETLRKTNIDPGGFAEYVRIPSINVEKGTFLLPDNVSYEEATFVEPLACVLRGQRQANVKKGKTVLVIGSGIAGILHINFAKSLGAEPIVATDINNTRLDLAKKFGADFTFLAKEYDPKGLRAVNEGRLADVVILCAGAPGAISQGLRSIDRGGTVLVFAPTDKAKEIAIPYNELFWRTEISVTSSYAGSPEDYKEALNLISSNELQIKAMITHRLGLDEIGKAFKFVSEAKESLKIIIEPQKQGFDSSNPKGWVG